MHRPRLRWNWIAILAAALVVFVCGVLGFGEHARHHQETRTLADLFYLTGQLFTMNSGAVEVPVPLNLEIARFLAPLVAGSAIIETFAVLFSVELRRWTLRLRRGHFIVCGLGRKGARLVEELRQAGKRVVVIEPDEHNPGLAHCRAMKVIVIRGRSDDDWILSRAYVNRAATLIATAGSDSVNIETAMRARAISHHRKHGRLRCVAHLTDPALQQVLKSHDLFVNQRDPFDLELVNVYEVGARVMLERAGFARRAAFTGDTRLCLVGLGYFGEAVLRRLLRDWAIHEADASASAEAAASLEIVIIDRQAAEKESSFRQRYQDFLGNVRLHFVTRDVRAPEFAGPNLEVSRPGQTFSGFLVCFDDDSLATLAAIRIRDRFDPPIPIVVRMSEQAGFANLMDCGSTGCGSLEGIRSLGFLDIACMRDLFLGGDIEIIGRAFHEAYLEERLAAGDTPESNPAVVPWDLLKEKFRASSRARAGEIREQLSGIGLCLVSCPDRPVALHCFSPAHLDGLARIEHERWLEGKRRDGWKYGPVRDDNRKHNPLMKAWEELSEADKAFNLATVKRLPAILARADFEIREKGTESNGRRSPLEGSGMKSPCHRGCE
ncbi:MAG: NAD-binding protein [Verrucomicrobiales bacterium]|nr:NAD-binding protein [Verrucomicrobiae bacterium]